MAKDERVTVTVKMVYNTGNYTSATFGVSLEAQLEPGERLEDVAQHMAYRVFKEIEEAKENNVGE